MKKGKKIDKITSFLRVFFVVIFITIGFFGFVYILDTKNSVIAIIWIVFSFLLAIFIFTLIPFFQEIIILVIKFKETSKILLSIKKKIEEIDKIMSFKL